MSVPHIYKKILSQLANQYQNWDNDWSAKKNGVRQAITGTRITKQDAEKVLRELETMRKMRRINQRKVKLLL